MANQYNLTNRETIRDALKTLIETHLETTNTLIGEFFAFQPTAEEMGGQSPVGWISSGGSEIDDFTMNQRKLTTFDFTVQFVILLASGNSATAEDRIDAINKEMRDLFSHEDQRAKLGDGGWNKLELGKSACGYSIIGGKEYRTEVYPLTVEVKDD